MSEAIANPRLHSLARACRRVADDLGAAGAATTQGAAGLRPIAEHLHATAERLEELAGPAPALPGGLVENALNHLLEPLPATFAPPEGAHERLLHAKGDLATTADLISFLSSLRLTGTLEIVTAPERFELELQEGDIVHAQSDGAPVGDRLGDILVEQGAVARERVEAVRRACTGDRLGFALWQQSVVTHKQLVTALEEQIRRQFARMFELSPQEFAFWSGPPRRAQRQLRLNATGLILDGARAADERSRQD